MPRHSRRQIKLRFLEKRYTLWMKFRLALHRNTPHAIDIEFSDSESESDSSDSSDNSTVSIEQDPPAVQAIMQEYLEVSSNRYISRPHREKSGSNWHLFAFTHFSQRQFRTSFRMSKTSFIALLGAIQHHEVFQNQSHCPQKPVALQLMITLYHFYGQARARAAHQFDVGEGTIHLYVNRVIEAILSLQDQYIKWPMPGSNDYKQTTDMHQHQFGFPNCLGFVDGSNVSLFRKPSIDGSRYYNRKARYALNITVIVDGNTKILWLMAGSKSLIKSHC